MVQIKDWIGRIRDALATTARKFLVFELHLAAHGIIAAAETAPGIFHQVFHRFTWKYLWPDAHYFYAIDTVALIGGVVALAATQGLKACFTQRPDGVIGTTRLLLEVTHCTHTETGIYCRARL